MVGRTVAVVPCPTLSRQAFSLFAYSCDGLVNADVLVNALQQAYRSVPSELGASLLPLPGDTSSLTATESESSMEKELTLTKEATVTPSSVACLCPPGRLSAVVSLSAAHSLAMLPAPDLGCLL